MYFCKVFTNHVGKRCSSFIINTTYKGKVYERQVTVARFLFYLFLFSYKIVPTVVVNEYEEKQKTYGYLEDSDWIEPVTKSDLNLMLYRDADQVIVEDKGTIIQMKACLKTRPKRRLSPMVICIMMFTINQRAPKTGRKPVKNRANRLALRIPNLLIALASKYLIVL